MFKQKTLSFRITFTEPILGTLPSNEEIFTEFIGSKAPDASTLEEEVAALGADAVTEKGTTVFAKDESGVPYLYDYHIKGLFKAAAGALKRVPGTESSKVKAYKKIIDQLIFTYPRRIMFENYKSIGSLERPLRAQTMQGDRVALAKSELIPAGATLTFDVGLFDPSHESLVKEWLDYGAFSGLGQWRNASYGRFTWEEI